MNIFIDLDGTIIDFMGGLQDSLDYHIMRDEWPEGEYDLKKVFPPTKHIFQPLDWHSFWVHLSPYLNSMHLIQTCMYYGKTYFVSDCGGKPAAYAGKVEWMRSFGFDAGRLIITSDRSWIHDKDFLIDDKDDSGADYLVPRIWNIAHALAQSREVKGNFLLYDLAKDIVEIEKLLKARRPLYGE